jgi:hypothetical protein
MQTSSKFYAAREFRLVFSSGDDAMSELSVASEEVRRDLRTATIVQHAMTLMTLAGAAEAATYMRNNEVPHSVIERVLTGESYRRTPRCPLKFTPAMVQPS